jgi:hypothetical protein
MKYIVPKKSYDWFEKNGYDMGCFMISQPLPIARPKQEKKTKHYWRDIKNL